METGFILSLCFYCDNLFVEPSSLHEYCAHDIMHYSSPEYQAYLSHYAYKLRSVGL